jgi:hypothetical protein
MAQATINLEYGPVIPHAPIAQGDLYRQAASNDEVTINAWRHYWIHQYRHNQKHFGPFADRSIAKLFKKHLGQTAILVGSGPSLKKNAHQLKDVPAEIPVVSCLHNFHFLEDLGVRVDYYVSLDCGPITVDEVSEGGNPETDYWEKTKGKTLLAYAGSWPQLLEKWQGEILFFNAPIPDAGIQQQLAEIEKFNIHVSNGGNVLGACLYIAKAFLGCPTVVFLGADFSFSYDSKFHSWNSQYDAKIGQAIHLTDVYGVRVKTWPSYRNFKSFFEWVAQQVPGEYINCTEGGCLGSYPDGNIAAIKQMDLKDFLNRYSMCNHMQSVIDNPKTDDFKILY